MSIDQWPVNERPREKLLHRGPSALSDAELLAVILRTGSRGCSAIELSRRLIGQYGGFRRLLGASQDEFCQSKGLGVVKYIQLQAILEMARRYFWEELDELPAITSASQARDYIYVKLCDYPREVFSCLFLDSQNRVIRYEELFHGTINQAPVFPRELAKKALDLHAAAIILAHNHPSGVCEPSQADRQITEVICDALALFDIRVLDHFVIGKKEAYSFAEHGLL